MQFSTGDRESGVMLFCLDFFATIEGYLKAMPKEFKEAWLKHTLIRRLGTPRDQANAIVFLASDEASWITGHLMEVCGGYGLAANMYGDIVEPEKV